MKARPEAVCALIPWPASEYDEISRMSDDLSSLKDDMVAFIFGHGMSRFQGYVTEDVHSVMWDPRGNPESCYAALWARLAFCN